MKKLLWLCLVLFSLVTVRVKADVDYTIDSYEGSLVIHEDNTATFRQIVTYTFDSTYRGQYVSLGKAGKMPPDFDIVSQPSVKAYRNGVLTQTKEEFESLSDGYRLKVYNAGKSGESVVLEVTWELKNILYLHQDVAELNWVPISDWDETIERVVFHVTTDKQVEDSQLFVHRGYFKSSPRIRSDGNGYTFETDSVSGQLELRAYWDKAIISLPSQTGKLAKESIIQSEKKIQDRGRLLALLYFKLQPALVLAFVLLGSLYFAYVRRGFRPQIVSHRLYQAPADLNPLLVAKAVYGSTLRDPQNDVTFDQMMQASLLDLMDKGVVTIADDKKTLIRHKDKPQSRLDKLLLRFLFGDQLQIRADHLFEHYAVDDTIFKEKGLKGSALQARVNQKGQQLERAMRDAMRVIDNEVQIRCTQEGQKLCHRPLTKQELSRLNRGGLPVRIALLVTFVMGVVALVMSWGVAFMVSVLLLILSSFALWGVNSAKGQVTELGVLTEEGERIYQDWQAYRKMFRDLGNFAQAELESLVIWNQVLVYATLFGEAKRVQNYLKQHHIQLSNDHLDTYVSYSLYRSVNRSISNYHSYSTTASNASNFSVSSSSGGGFSGGGGGGGGGAF